MGTNAVREEYRTFADRVRRARKATRLTQEALGDKIAKSREWVQGVEAARIIPTDLETTASLARAVLLDPTDLWGIVVELRTPEDQREVWLRRVAAARLSAVDLTEAERTVMLTLRSFGGRMGDDGVLVRMLADLLKGWEWADSAVMRSMSPPGSPRELAPVQVHDLLTVLDIVRSMSPSAQRGFVNALAPLAQAFGIAQVHGSPEFGAIVRERTR
jgi:transcriptional regulator with XRE-family HTH domain